MRRHRDNPTFPNWDQDDTAREDRYAAQDPKVVAGQLAAAAHRWALEYAGCSPAERGRTGMRSNGSPFTIATSAPMAATTWPITSGTSAPTDKPGGEGRSRAVSSLS